MEENKDLINGVETAPEAEKTSATPAKNHKEEKLKVVKPWHVVVYWIVAIISVVLVVLSFK